MDALVIAGRTDVGQRRTDNQDTFVCTPIWSETTALLAAIDGVGGYAGGDRAAAIAKESLEQYMTKPNGDPLSMLREAVVFANNQINQAREQNPGLAQMCCVLTTALVDVSLGKLVFVHVGDSRLYRYRQGVLEKLTHDHSMVGIREDANELTEAEAMHHPRRNEILREVGSTPHRVDDPEFLESGETDFLPGDQLLLCSDGLTDMITRAQIVGVLTQSVSLDEQTVALIRLANEQGGNDNITVVLARNTLNTVAVASPLPATAEPAQPLTDPILTVPAAESKAPAVPARRSMGGIWALLVLLLAVIVAGIVWWQYQPAGDFDLVADSLKTRQPATDSPVLLSPVFPADSLVQIAYRSVDHRLVLPTDTVRLDKPLLINDSLQSIVGGDRFTVIVPADTGRAQLAIRITRRGLVNLENIVISGFKTGIEMTGEGKLSLTKVYFRGVDMPVSAAIHQDSSDHSILTVSVQNLPVLPQTPRP